MLYVGSCLNAEPKHKNNVIKKKKKNIFYSSKPCSLHEKDKKDKQTAAKQQLGGSRGWIKGSEQPLGRGSY